MKKLFLITLTLIGLSSVNAQSYQKLSLYETEKLKILQSTDTLKILAVMVDFQADKYDATIGTGKFGSNYTKNYGDTILDPLPHNSNYFSDHLLFAKNYFKKVSRGKLNLNYNVLPDVITVSKTMREYVPGYQSNDLTPLGNFAKEVWELAANKFTNVKFSDYNLFLIFHAGVSSGLDLGIFSIDRNMPSIYLGLNSLQKIFGNQFNGFNTNNGKISNSIILPETESRELTAVDNSTVLIELTINGEIVANIASYLGLPDLYNTDTGISAIGRFGLMDGQAIIANNGMFPPEPSPWEKIYLGWEQPITISGEYSNLHITTQVKASAQDTTLLKIPLNSTEYFLLENRQQDANNDKVKINYKRNGQIYTAIVEKDTSGLYNITPQSIPGGVLIDVDEYDAAVPGNGIVIWHIDENIINNKLLQNKINNDPDAKGVAVVEADGITDIGHKFSSPFGISIGEGSKEDFWYSGNQSKFYTNRFANDTKPNTKSNSGANSLIDIDKFSISSNKMSFNLSYNSGTIKLVSSTKLNLSQNNLTLVPRSFTFQNYIFITDNSNLYKYDLNGKLLKTIANFSEIQPIVFDYNSAQYVIGGKGTLLNIYSLNGTDEKFKTIDCKAQRVTALGVDLKSNIPNILLALWIPNARAYKLPIDILLSMTNFNTTAYSIFESYYEITNFGIDNGFYTALGYGIFFEYSGNPNSMQLFDSGYGIKSILTKDSKGNYLSVVLLQNNKFILVRNGVVQSSFQVSTGSTIKSFSVADLFNDGQNYILLLKGNSLEAYNFNGASAKNFPFNITEGENFIGTPLAVDLNRDGFADVIAFTDKGNIYAINPVDGKVLNGFPISSGVQFASQPILIAEELPTMGPIPTYKPYLAVLDKSNQLYVWNLSSVQGKSYWSGEFGDGINNSFVPAADITSQPAEFFPQDKAYNWPNPVYGGTTHIRYYVSENSEVKIKIVDLNGEKVAEFNVNATGGMDNETVWDVSNIQSGIYYAVIDATGVSGNSAKKIVKIAVIK